VKSLSILPQLNYFSAELARYYPEGEITDFLPQLNASFLNNQVKLTLIFNDAAAGLSSLSSDKEMVDAWFLDGFSPAKNPDMWSKSLFSQIGRLSKEQATLTTFTVAGTVKRNLRDVGFRLEKQLAKGKKKEMFVAVMQSSPLTQRGYQLRPRIIKPQHVSIIGGGIASACAAYVLTKQGVKVTLYCKDNKIAQGASSNNVAALYPLLHQQHDEISSFYQQAFWHARSLYDEVNRRGFSFSHQWCGLLEVSYNEALVKRQHAFEQCSTWPKSLIHGVNAQQASTLANVELPYGGLFMPNAGWVSPTELVTQLFNAAKKTNRLKIVTHTEITKIQQVKKTFNDKINDESNSSTSWLLSSNQGNFNASVLVVCGGAEAITIEQISSLPLNATRGQVSNMATNSIINKLSTVLCHKGYVTPSNKKSHCIGATFQKNNTSTKVNKDDDCNNLATLAKCLPDLSQEIGWNTADITSSKARLRCTSQDHLPLVGAVPNIDAHINTYPHLAKDKNWKYSEPAPCLDNLYVLLGLGARGLCSAPLAADILSAELCNTPYPVDNQMLFNLSPNRFIIRDIIKRKVNT
jgi:tRNA 5-methylaminomethyl-2-thiouridine biosynthesis bifunctional protein